VGDCTNKLMCAIGPHAYGLALACSSLLRRLAGTRRHYDLDLVGLLVGAEFGHDGRPQAAGLQVLSVSFANDQDNQCSPDFSTLGVGIAGHSNLNEALGRMGIKARIYVESCHPHCSVHWSGRINLSRAGVALSRRMPPPAPVPKKQTVAGSHCMSTENIAKAVAENQVLQVWSAASSLESVWPARCKKAPRCWWNSQEFL